MASFNGTSQYLQCASPKFTAAPMSFGAWVRPTSIAAGFSTVFDWVSSTNDWAFQRSAATWSLYAGSATTTFGTVAVGVWYYILFRYLSTTNARASVLSHAGTIDHAQVTTNVAVTPAKWVIGAVNATGATRWWAGDIAEFWLSNVDVYPGGGQVDNAFLHQLAYRGPFSIPGFSRQLVDYRSLRGGDPTQPYNQAGLGAPAWTNNGNVQAGALPPVIGGYRTLPGSGLIVPV
jgi:hypothetical protein